MSTNGRTLDGTLALLLAASLALPGAAPAQQAGQEHRHGEEQQRAEDPEMPGMMMGMQGHGEMMGMGMMGMMAAPSPTMLLHQREALALTGEQVARLKALQERMARTRDEHIESMHALHRKLAEQVRDPDLDLAAHESTLRSLADAHVAMQVEMARVGQEARELLAAEQRAKLRTGMQFMRAMRMGGEMTQGMPGMMMHRMHGEMQSMRPGGARGAMMGGMPCPMRERATGSHP